MASEVAHVLIKNSLPMFLYIKSSVYTNGISFIHNEKWNHDICNKINRTGNYYINHNNLESNRKCMFSYKWVLEFNFSVSLCRGCIGHETRTRSEKGDVKGKQSRCTMKMEWRLLGEGKRPAEGRKEIKKGNWEKESTKTKYMGKCHNETHYFTCYFKNETFLLKRNEMKN